jgi:hypothetical protein
MLFEKFKKTVELNKTTIDFPGKKIYYDKIYLWVALILNMAGASLFLFEYLNENGWGYLAGIGLFLFFVPEKIRKLLFKNPVFIFQNDKFYYSLENCWVDKTNSKVSYPWQVSAPESIEINYLNDTIIITETLMYLDDATVFRKEINQYSSNKTVLTYIEEQFDDKRK